MERVSLQELVGATGGRAIGFASSDVCFDRVSTDTRTASRGDLYFALKGPRHDGHDYLDDAARQNVAACVVHERSLRQAHGPAVAVRDTTWALADLARWWRMRCDALVIGVTGSVGKTTTREMIHAVLSAEHSGMRSPRNYNNEVGLPLSLLDLERGHEFAVLELGASHVGEIRALAAVAAPEIGVVTAAGLAHLGDFGSEEAIVEAKGELLESLPEHGFAVLAGDNPRVAGMRERAACRSLLVGEGPHNDCRAEQVRVELQRLSFTVDGQRYSLAATGRQHLVPALCAVTIGREIGMAPDAIARGLAQFVPVAGRSRLERVGPWHVIDDTYNASPDSMRAACRLLADLRDGIDGQRWLVVGDMLALGPRAEQLHYELGHEAAQAGLDGLLAFGEHAAAVARGARTGRMDMHRVAECADLQALLTVLDCWLEPGDLLLVKGSRDMRMERVVDWLRTRAASQLQTAVASYPQRACA